MLNKSPAVVYDFVTGLPIPQVAKSSEDILVEKLKAPPYKTETYPPFKSVILPMIRKIVPSLIAADLIGVQPMTGPVGELYTIRYTNNEEKDTK